jgi:hypothetical protein
MLRLFIFRTARTDLHRHRENAGDVEMVRELLRLELIRVNAERSQMLG